MVPCPSAPVVGAPVHHTDATRRERRVTGP